MFAQYLLKMLLRSKQIEYVILDRGGEYSSRFFLKININYTKFAIDKICILLYNISRCLELMPNKNLIKNLKKGIDKKMILLYNITVVG